MKQAQISTEKDLNYHASSIVVAITSYMENDGRYLPVEKLKQLESLEQNIQASSLVTPYEILELSKIVGEDTALEIMDAAKKKVAIDRTLKLTIGQ